MKLEHEIDVTLRGEPVWFEFRASSPDPSVGCFGYTLEEWRVVNSDGEALDWILTDEELQGLQSQVDGYMNAWMHCDE